MLSYRHAYHAGNHADLLKHFILYLVLDYFNRKDKPYWYIDTHSGAGLYDLTDDKAEKVGEYRQGITRLRASGPLPPPLQDFRNRLERSLPQPDCYPGSPWLAQAVLRDSDKLRLFELHPADFQNLSLNMQAAGLKRRGILKQEDGYHGLITLLPPPTRRAVVLIDPPYEEKQDYARVLHTLQEAHQRFAQGCYLLWYPCLSREESRKLPEQLRKRFAGSYLNAELHVHTPRSDGFGMHGSGMFAINPPYLLAEQLEHTLPALCSCLAQDAGAHFTLTHETT